VHGKGRAGGLALGGCHDEWKKRKLGWGGGESRSGAAKWKDVGSGGDAWREGGWPMGCVGRLAWLSRKGNEFSIFNFLSK
jgi:hypothetical protein